MPERAVVGFDVQPIEEVEASLREFGDRYRHLLFTDHELECSGEGPESGSKLAARFAAKEAVMKILNVGPDVPPWRSVEVKCATDGRTEIVLHDSAANLARLEGMHNLTVAFSVADGVAVAAVVASVVSEPERADR
jgi:holo-[acyl-carrier protein] synthase